jgi:hypothetical protein
MLGAFCSRDLPWVECPEKLPMSQIRRMESRIMNEVRTVTLDSQAALCRQLREGLLGSGPLITLIPPPHRKPPPKAHGLGFSANSLQQIGAYVGQNPILFESKQQTKVLLKVSKTLEQIERAQRLTGGGFLA